MVDHELNDQGAGLSQSLFALLDPNNIFKP